MSLYIKNPFKINLKLERTVSIVHAGGVKFSRECGSIFHSQLQKGSARKRLPSIVSERFTSRSNARLRIVSHLRMPSRLRELLVSRGLYLRRPRAVLGDRRQLVYWNFSGTALVVVVVVVVVAARPRPCPHSRSAFPRSRGKATLITTVKFLNDESPF